MKKLLIQQQVFSWRDRFHIMNEDGKECYFAEGELFTFGKKLHVYDTNNDERIYIEQKLFSFLPHYYAFADGDLVAEVVKEFSFFRPRYRIEGLGWEVHGNFLEHEYEIWRDEKIIAVVKKAWLTWGDFYELEIADDKDELPALAVLLCIDSAVAQADASVSVSFN